MAKWHCVLIRVLSFLFVLTSGITWVLGQAGEGVAGRVTIADIVALGLLAYWAFLELTGKGARLVIPRVHSAFFPLFAVFCVGVIISDLPQRGAMEIMVHAFGFVSSLVLLNLVSRLGYEEGAQFLISAVLHAGGTIALIGILDFLVLGGRLGGQGTGGLAGTFRNTGQAGAFFGTYLALVIPGFTSKALESRPFNVLSLLALLIALLFTAKRAAVIGLAVGGAGTCLMLFFARERGGGWALRLGVILVLFIPLAHFLFQWGWENVQGMESRFTRKFSSDAAEDFEEGFLEENLSASYVAFSRGPIVGVGLGNVAGVITAKYEIHSTYLAVVAQCGLLGLVAYAHFMWRHFRATMTTGKEPFSLYLSHYRPWLLGLLVSWSYTYHLRKREFWVLLCVVALAYHAALHPPLHNASRRAGS